MDSSPNSSRREHHSFLPIVRPTHAITILRTPRPLVADGNSTSEIPSPGRVAPSLKATPLPRLDKEPLNHVISQRDLAQANVSRLSKTKSLKTPILLAWVRYRAQKRSSLLATSLRRAVPRLSETKSLNTKPRSPGRAARSQIRREVLQLSPRRDRLAWARLAEFPHCIQSIPMYL
ncbi:hypothetical protein DEO72_LG3g726 [Vigna unguiculata]|uniref:Uncharacterized protein n=1 Tax=Vigna unguiculata TaxID=3917 RepID=A0A4D6LCZ0_VIGUN|nr:hypothetical protein DEO72_LG3g726 [Vigna unguiculata]